MRRTTTRDSLLVLAIAGAGLALAVQGWRGRIPGVDVVPYVEGARRLIAHGDVPDHGTVTGLGSYAPPGIAWTLLPGLLLFSDPRLFDLPGAMLLHAGTLIGIVLLAAGCAGRRVAVLAATIYGVSDRGLAFAATLGAGSLGPRAHPFFVVWIAYWAWLWVTRRDGRYFAAALLTWLAGMNYFMELAPAILALPVLWSLYRPPIAVRVAAVACALGLLIWYPYLKFEAARSFRDLRSQVLTQTIGPSDYSPSLCDPSLPLLRSPEAPRPLPVYSASTGAGRAALGAGRRALTIANGLLGNFNGLLPGSAPILLALTLAGIAMMGRRPHSKGTNRGADAPVYRAAAGWSSALGVFLLAWSILGNEAVLGRVARWLIGDGLLPIAAVRNAQVVAALAGAALLARRWIGSQLGELPDSLTDATTNPRAVAVLLCVPWAAYLAVVEWGRDDRLACLSPLQAIALALAVAAIASRVGNAFAPARRILPIAIVSVVALNPTAQARIEGLRDDGWAGADAVEVRTAGSLAAVLHAAGKSRAVIGQRTFRVGPPELPWRAVDTLWRTTELNVMLEYRHAIVNLNECPEGVSAADEYRVVESRPGNPQAAYYFDAEPRLPLTLLARVDRYDIYGPSLPR